MKQPITWIIALLAAAGIGTAAYYFWPTQQTPPAVPAGDQVELPAPDTGIAEPGPEHPLTDPNAGPAAKKEPLPTLSESDAPIVQSLAATPSASGLEQFLIPNNIVRRFVTTIDNLPRQKVAVQLRPLKPTPGSTIVNGNEDAQETLTLSEQNYARYEPFVALVKSADSKQVADSYRHFYPLLQQSYEDLGYPKKYFNDRMVQVIDHLLATPDVQGPVELVRPKVFFEFADPKLEGLSAGQKLLIRMGSANAAVIKEKLKAFRREIASGAPPAGG